MAYAGVDATVYQTGQFQAARAHMSKRSSPYSHLALLCKVASMAIQNNEELRAYYH